MLPQSTYSPVAVGGAAPLTLSNPFTPLALPPVTITQSPKGAPAKAKTTLRRQWAAGHANEQARRIGLRVVAPKHPGRRMDLHDPAPLAQRASAVLRLYRDGPRWQDALRRYLRARRRRRDHLPDKLVTPHWAEAFGGGL